jgi:hypothetical protein
VLENGFAEHSRKYGKGGSTDATRIAEFAPEQARMPR